MPTRNHGVEKEEKRRRRSWCRTRPSLARESTALDLRTDTCPAVKESQHVRVLEKEEEGGGAEANVLSRTESMRSSKTILPRVTKHCRHIHRSCPAVAQL